ncbi:hypothetical protein BCU68_03845 [Vibrio sp. 10N.286.49.B3]|uniref:hypothetical protein n=1 Tax=Vibrio sp. 10N.286.49.B3 TaxID=1880855 RepID=UPI000C835B03|nr:hypothetical protein [Vibrio sp. 10N.286.49.B3]PMH43131.1 hypothetical protein BCU68_03845 [Vibrio sp. 10N.286.49.B3]
MHIAIKIIAILLASIAGFYAPALVSGLKSVTTATSTTHSLSIEDYCFLSTQPCTQQGVTMSVDKDKSQPLIPTTITVQWHDNSAAHLELELEGLEMSMGTAKYVLHSQGNGRYGADIILPVCTLDEMTWVGTLTDGNQSVFPALRMAR